MVLWRGLGLTIDEVILRGVANGNTIGLFSQSYTIERNTTHNMTIYVVALRYIYR